MLSFAVAWIIGGIIPFWILSSNPFFILQTRWQSVLSLASDLLKPQIFITLGHFNCGTSIQRFAALSYLGSVFEDGGAIKDMFRNDVNSVAAVFPK